MKKRIFLVAAALLLLSVTGYGTLAYTVVEGKAVNVITSGDVDIKLHETADHGKPFPVGGVQGVVPGETYTKIVRVENSGEETAWVCLRVETEVTLADGSRGDGSCVSLDIDKTHWARGEDGLYYYKSPLAPGELTRPIFTQVQFDPAMGNVYQGSKIDIRVQALATQREHNGDTVWDARGWPKEG